MKKILLWVAIIISVIALIVAFLYVFYLPRTADDAEIIPIETVKNTVAPEESVTTTAATPTTEVLTDETLGIQLTSPSDWSSSREASINPSEITHSGISVQGQEGSVRILNTTGLGGGPCSSFGYEQIELKVLAGLQSVCHWVDAGGTEHWQTVNFGTNNIDNDLVVAGADMAIHISATANAPSEENRDIVLSVLQSLDFITIK